MDTGKAIKELRKKKGLTQTRLAEIVGITQPAMSAIENGARPNIGTMERLCKAVGVPEALIYVMAIEKGDVPKKNKELYDLLFPVIKQLVILIATH